MATDHYIQHQWGETHFLSWGSSEAPPLLVVHGLGGNAANYLDLAEYLSSQYWVIAPDLPGRGLSSWALDANSHYSFPTYEAVILKVLTSLGIDKLRWIGTSMGGALGIRLGAGVLAGRITHLLINDIGPTLDESVVEQIVQSASSLPICESLTDLAQWLLASFSESAGERRSLEYWLARARYFSRRCDDGRYTLHYDPRVVLQLRHRSEDYEQWEAFDALDMPMMLIRGEQSSVLTAEIMATMTARKPRLTTLVVPDRGHAPLLEDTTELESIGSFLQS